MRGPCAKQGQNPFASCIDMKNRHSFGNMLIGEHVNMVASSCRGEGSCGGLLWAQATLPPPWRLVEWKVAALNGYSDVVLTVTCRAIFY